LSDALAVTIALILDPNANAAAMTEVTADDHSDTASDRQLPGEQPLGVDGRREQNEPAPTHMARHSDDARVSQTPAPSPSRAAPLEWRAWVGAGLGSWQPWLVESGAALLSNSWGLELGAFYQPSHDYTVGPGKVRLATLGGLAAGCLQRGSLWRGTLCIRGMAGAERARGIGFDRDDTRLLATASLGPSVGIESGSTWIWGVHIMGQVVVFQDNYVLEHDASALQAPPVTAWLVARVSLSSRGRGR
jgi:hypothetical protein